VQHACRCHFALASLPELEFYHDIATIVLSCHFHASLHACSFSQHSAHFTHAQLNIHALYLH
jgi:hypothetical protein